MVKRSYQQEQPGKAAQRAKVYRAIAEDQAMPGVHKQTAARALRTPVELEQAAR